MRSRLAQGPDLLGKVVDQRFRVLSLIGSGGMADVYEVEHVTLGRKLALKVLRHTSESNAALARRFNREARALSRISSEHVVSIFDYGILPEGYPFFVMELLRGQTLRALLEAEHQLTPLRACHLAIDVCLGLHATHQAGLVHRDLKPENLWLTRRDDGREACILLDFGVARVEGTHTTSDGVLIGTARYMSPEQIGSDVAPGPQSDVFALGVILHECVCGVSPFAADTLERTLFRVLNDSPRPVSETTPGVLPELDQLLSRALNKECGARFASALDMAKALLPLVGSTRQIPGLSAGAAVAASVTLAEEDPPAPPVAGVEDDSDRESSAAPRPPSLRWGGLLASFAVGAGLGAFALRSAGSAPTTLPGPLPSTQTVELDAPRAASLQAPPSPVSTASANVPETPSATPLKKARSSPRPSSPRPADSSEPPGRLEPPRPTFDGRNPYRP